MTLCDLHLHSNNSFDAENTVEQMCLSAIDKKFFAIAITDHCETDAIHLGDNCEFGNLSVHIPKSLYETNVAKGNYSEKIHILSGIEIGQPLYDLKSLESIVNYNDYDFILASIHNLKNKEDFYYINYTKENVKPLLKEYFETLIELSTWENFDSLAHLTYPLRYIKERTNIVVDLNDYNSQIEKIFLNLIKYNKALEINTSGLRKAISTTLPDTEIIKLYHRLGGKLITLGSDAHNKNDLGKGIVETINILKSIGFEYYVIYEKHIPKKIKI